MCRVEGWQVALREWRKFRVPVTLLTVSADAKLRWLRWSVAQCVSLSERWVSSVSSLQMVKMTLLHELGQLFSTESAWTSTA